MRILLEELPHQEKALNDILNSFKGLDNSVNDEGNENPYSNPLINERNLEESNIDVKMETGTGKTYVYTRMIYEFHKRFGLFKFIIVVPTPSIKEGTKSFIESNYAKQHFSQFYENTRINLNVINAGDFKSKSKRKNFPPQLIDFAEGSKFNSKTIEVLLINAQMLNSNNMKKDDYDQTLLSGVTSPIDALKLTFPIVIIDEPHKFPRDGAFYKSIEVLKPQMIIRFGATFPETSKGRGSNKINYIDYYRGKPQHDLNAIDSFNNGLVKGVDIYYPKLSEDQAKNKYHVDKVTAKELVLRQKNRKWTLKVGDNLANVDDNFEGNVTYAGPYDRSKILSNELEIGKGMSLIPGTFKNSYQELIIQDAIDKHFEIEEENFLRENEIENNSPKIKTLSLFFIDNIESYRDENGWLKEIFNDLLGKKLEKLIKKYSSLNLPREKEYYEFLLATQYSLNHENQNVHAGYFGKDRKYKDEAIQAEVEDILKNKEKLLSFKDDNGIWETRRFLFSKWTLREGWDNPNVFVIAKLRTSGSETSKIQEVGRGLRLPVDEFGHRLQQDEWESRLAYLIGCDEREFGEKLRGEINADSVINHEELTEDMIKIIVNEEKKSDNNYDEEQLLNELDDLGIITRSNKFKDKVEINGEIKNGFEWLLEKYPIISTKLVRKGKINDNKKNKTNKIKINTENWNKMKDLWEKFSQRFMLEFDRVPNKIEEVAKEVFCNRENYQIEMPEQISQRLNYDENENEMNIVETVLEYNDVDFSEGIPYGKFIKEIAMRTSLPIKIFHPLLIYMLKEYLNSDSRYLSEITLNNLIKNFKKSFDKNFDQSYKYEPLDFKASTSIYDSKTGKFKDYVNANDIGVMSENNALENPRYLYKLPPMLFDSYHPERDLINREYDEKVIVYGKLPKKSIQVPKYTGGTTTPDFIYVIEKKDLKNRYLIVETKAENMRLNDVEILNIQNKFFKEFGVDVEYKDATTVDEVNSKLKELLDES
ncbi:MAG: type III restriction-modification system endonuclease [Methanobrevibacter sp.]|jgi:type III restriction enzyme|nr:type III restriction-modification system endonuclease [Candidatus Methanoflexus mossambicus]